MAKVAPLIRYADSGEAASTAQKVISSVDRDHENHSMVHLVHTWSAAVWTEMINTLGTLISLGILFQKKTKTILNTEKRQFFNNSRNFVF